MTTRQGSTLTNLRLTQVPDLLKTLYRRAPATVLTVSSLVISYLANLAYLDYTLFRSLGPGGFRGPPFLRWLVHAFVFPPLAMSEAATRDPSYLPPPDKEWNQRNQGTRAQHRLHSLPQRSGDRPEVFGFVPHRQIERIEKDGSEMQKRIIAHLESLASTHSASLTMAQSSFEAGTSPCLFVKHELTNSDGTTTSPTRLSKLYLSGNPAPQRNLQGVSISNSNPEYHELAHVHLSEGSLHVTLSPQDARKVITQGWGELHPLAGMLYRGHYLPPYWIPNWIIKPFGGQSQARWSYLHRKHGIRGKLLPPTYTLLYAPNTPEQVEWVKAILDSAVSWAVGEI